MTELEAAAGGRRFYALRGVRDNVYVNDVPRSPVTRAAKLAGLPIGLAGRTALGVGKRIGGGPGGKVGEGSPRRPAGPILPGLGGVQSGGPQRGHALSLFEGALPPPV